MTAPPRSESGRADETAGMPRAPRDAGVATKADAEATAARRRDLRSMLLLCKSLGPPSSEKMFCTHGGPRFLGVQNNFPELFTSARERKV